MEAGVSHTVASQIDSDKPIMHHENCPLLGLLNSMRRMTAMASRLRSRSLSFGLAAIELQNSEKSFVTIAVMHS